MPDASLRRLINVTLDERTVVRRSPDVEHERRVAIFDLLEANLFDPAGVDGGPFILHLSIEENRLSFDVRTESEEPCVKFVLSLTPFRRIIKDYFIVCESYYDAIRNAPPSRIEALDMGRRSLHDEGCQILHERLDGKVTLNLETARRLFTLVCVLHIKG